MADQNKSPDDEDSGQASGDNGASETLFYPSSRNLSSLDNIDEHEDRHVGEPVDALAVATRPHSLPHTGVRHRQGELQETPRQADQQATERNENRANPCQGRSLRTYISEFLNWFFYSPSFSSSYSPTNVLYAISLTYIIFIIFLYYQDNKSRKSR